MVFVCLWKSRKYLLNTFSTLKLFFLFYFKVSKNGIFNFHESYLVSGAHNTISDIRCPLPNLRLRRSVDKNYFVFGYKIAVSNNAEDFSSTHFLYILDSVCQDTLNISGQLKFALKVNILCYYIDKQFTLNRSY